MGTHWWNPPYLVPLVEVVAGRAARADAGRRGRSRCSNGAGKTPVHVKRDVPGFIGNRLQHALWREAIALVEAGVCDAEDVDTVVKASFGPGCRPRADRERRPRRPRPDAGHPRATCSHIDSRPEPSPLARGARRARRPGDEDRPGPPGLDRSAGAQAVHHRLFDHPAGSDARGGPDVSKARHHRGAHRADRDQGRQPEPADDPGGDRRRRARAPTRPAPRSSTCTCATREGCRPPTSRSPGATVGLIEESCPALIQLSTGVGLDVAVRGARAAGRGAAADGVAQPVHDELRHAASSATRRTGVRRLAARMRELGIKPELEIYDTGHLDVVPAAARRGPARGAAAVLDRDGRARRNARHAGDSRPAGRAAAGRTRSGRRSRSAGRTCRSPRSAWRWAATRAPAWRTR